MSQNGELSNSKIFCKAPWHSISIRNNNQVSICATSSFNFTVNEKSLLSEVINQKPNIDYRKNHYENWPVNECSICVNRAKLGIPHPKTTFDKIVNPVITSPETAVVDLSTVVHLDVNFSNVCNLKCRMCQFERSSEWKSDQKALSDAFSFVRPPVNQSEPLIEIDFENFKNLRAFVIKGGEPLFDKKTLAFLSRLADSERAASSAVTIFTNGVFVKKHIELLKKFKTLRLMFSFEGTGSLYQYIRGGELDFNNFAENVSSAVSFENIHPCFMYTPQAYNIFDFPKAYDFVTKFNNEFFKNKLSDRNLNTVFSNTLAEPRYLSIPVLPFEIRQNAVEKIKASGFSKLPVAAGLIAFLNQAQRESDYVNFLKFTKKLDQLRGQKVFDYISEFQNTQLVHDYEQAVL